MDCVLEVGCEESVDRSVCGRGSLQASRVVADQNPPMPTRPIKLEERHPDGLHDLSVRRYGFLLLDNFSLIALGAAVDPLRIANMIIGRRVYDYQLISAGGECVQSSDGIRVLPDATIRDPGSFDAVFVVGPNPIPRKGIGAVLDWLRLHARGGTALGGLDTGSYFLARAGLLNGYRCTIHWEDQDVLMGQFPKLIVSNRLYEVDRDRFTCSGGVAPLDLMVHLLGMPPGSRSLAARVLELLVAERRSHEQQQRTSLRQYMGAEHIKLDEALQIMESNVEEALSVAEVASYLGVSQRQLERWFNDRIGKTPAQAYLEIRLLRARQLLYRTGKSLEEVCSRTGFTSMTHFATRYKAQFKISPMSDRRRYQNAL
ncbi:HTH-type transcriptional regulator CdhR [Paraburkholderia domus]|jgi:Transcriptional regulator containing an amidase domain and an AraC-type DNA-binding HTH domain|uniref:HTH-type transcriptional regulator CdhR n=2 Tax=Burkholderiaceae TaxID=119060 RepID=A0A9N8MPM6_9BURK|nr:HTH-type transcriptional regulator CdhR [Paraburkholderia domus]CAE6851898.1 HTH-type transcriptional regulator CdhR [Paraburkholderia domus]CAE6880192.1 HTH-type transcriptional regulator CdhR [Paraburkholderia domus]CAE6887194.1 HTH-type transcriptional regulator CdhR [Paraburkholderia domus]CAE6895796.1 HTH-type transcriptional regulator CdhR [Paraburkholderia domus]